MSVTLSYLLDSSGCIPILRNQAGLGKLPAPSRPESLSGPLDLLIAAQARSLKATLVTGNASEFKRVKGLKVQEWHPA